jgi:phage/plasmid primase-like uncharacterized protein
VAAKFTQALALAKEKARGRWGDIFNEFAGEELAMAQASAPVHVGCPVHGGTDGFRLFKDYRDTGGGVCNSCGGFSDGIKLLTWVKGWDRRETVERVLNFLESGPSGGSKIKVAPKVTPPVVRDPEKARSAAARVWRGSRPIQEGTPAQLYLLKRGIFWENVSKALRYHPELNYFNSGTKKMLGKFPAIVAPISSPEGKIISLHRIYLDEQGNKADVPSVKKMMPAWGELRGAAIRLFDLDDSGVLCVAEGIETALAVHAITRAPTWSCVNATLMELLEVPDSVHTVVIWADKDPNGRGKLAADMLADRMEAKKKSVVIFLPQTEEPSADWLDVLNMQGISGFPAAWRRWRPVG